MADFVISNNTDINDQNLSHSNSCFNFDAETFNDIQFSNFIFLMNYNIRSFNSNFNEFSLFLNQLQTLPDVIILTETWFMGSNHDSIEGYHGYHCNRNPDYSGNGGGISVFIKKTLKCKIYVELCENLPEIEVLHLRLNINTSDNYHIIAVYRPPNGMLINKYFEKIDSILDKISVRGKVLLAGDLNINGLCNNNLTNNLKDIMASYSLASHISLPTRPNADGLNGTQIDHIWSNIEQITISGVFNTNVTKSDHFPSFIVFPTSIQKSKIKLTFRDHSETCLSNLINEIATLNSSFIEATIHMDYNDKFNFFLDKVTESYNNSCPLRTKILNSGKIIKPWIDNTICNKIKRKHYLFKRYKLGAISFHTYNNFKLKTEKDIITAKRNYFQTKFADYRGDSKNTWKFTNKLLNKNTKTSQNNFSLLENNNTIQDEKLISEIMNSYFIDVGHNLAQGIQSTNTDPLTYLPDRIRNSFLFSPTDADEICLLVSKFKNKRTSVDKLPIHVLKVIIPILAPILAQLFNESVTTGTFPEGLKTGCVIPLHKSGSHSIKSNFRPITTLSVFSKIFEKLVHTRMISFIKKYKILPDNQFGFQANKCTSDAILEFLDYGYETLNKSKHLLAIFLDFSKAFDTISIGILLKKLEHYGFRNNINLWLNSYLTNRKQFVKINQTTSNTLITKMGVPQGSTLGPLLFILYMSDMKQALDNMKVLHFADDSTLYLDVDKNNTNTTLINRDLESLNDWLSANKLFLNIDKTKYMIIHNRGRPQGINLNIGGSQVNRCEVHKFLGVFIDDQLNFKKHVESLNAKISRNLGILRKIKIFVPLSVLKNIFYALINSHYTYAITAYGFTNSIQLSRLTRLIDRSIKLILDMEHFSLENCKRNKILNFQLALDFFTLIKIQKILFTETHNYFTDKLNNYQIHHTANTRRLYQAHLTIPLMHFTKCQNAFIYQGSHSWNKLPLQLREITSSRKFKNKLKIHLLI